MLPKREDEVGCLANSHFSLPWSLSEVRGQISERHPERWSRFRAREAAQQLKHLLEKTRVQINVREMPSGHSSPPSIPTLKDRDRGPQSKLMSETSYLGWTERHFHNK